MSSINSLYEDIIKYNKNGVLLYYEESLFDKRIINDIEIGDIIMIKLNVCVVTNKTLSSLGRHSNPKMAITCKGIFDDEKYYDITPVNFSIFYPKIKKQTYLCNSVIKNNIVEAYDEITNEIIEIKINKNDNCIEKISNKLKKNDECKIQTIEFYKSIRIIEVN